MGTGLNRILSVCMLFPHACHTNINKIATLNGLKILCEHAWSVFQLTFKIRESMKNFDGSIALVLSKSSQVCHSFCRVRKLGFLGF